MLKVNVLFVQFLNSFILAHKNNNKVFFFKTNKLINNFCYFLKSNGFIFGYDIQTFRENKYVTVYFKYIRNAPIFSKIIPFSKYAYYRMLPKTKMKPLFLKSQGLYIISTTKGIFFLADAYKKGLGGVLLAKIFLF